MRAEGSGLPLREIALSLAAFSAAAVIYTWPVALHLRHVFPYPLESTLGQSDVYLTAWIIAWGAHRLRTDPLALFDANIFYPFRRTLAFTETILSGGLLALPIDLVGHDPVLVYNVVVLSTFVLGGTGLTLLLRQLGTSRLAALAGGALFVFGPTRLSALGSVQTLSTQWMPFTLLFLHRLLARGSTPGVALGFVACLVLTALGSVYYAAYFGIGLVLAIALHAAWRCPARPGTRLQALGLACLAYAALVPYFVPYARARAELCLVRDPAEAIIFSAGVGTYLDAWLAPLDYLRARYAAGEVFLGPGIAIGALALIGLAAGAGPRHGGRRLAALYASAALGMALISLGPRMRMRGFGPSIPGPYALLALVPGLDALRTPARAQSVALLFVAVLAGFGADAVLGRVRGMTARAAAGLALALVVLAEGWRPPLHPIRIPWQAVPGVYRWLATEPGDFPIVELPFGSFAADAQAMLLSTYHWKRMVNGHSGFAPGKIYLASVLSRFPDADALRLLHALRVRYAVVRPPPLAPPGLTLCETASPYLALRYREGTSCVLELVGAPPEPPRPALRPVATAGLRATASSGEDPGAVVDGDPDSHWVQPVDPKAPGWLQIDLRDARPLVGVVIHLGRHFGEYPRSLAVDVSEDGAQWRRVREEPITEAPVAQLLTRPDDLRVEVRFPPALARHLRLVRPAQGGSVPLKVFDGWWRWARWGAHEIELYEAPDAP